MFLDAVMNIPVDYERLFYGGVTKDAIHFISRMLITDPHARATDAELSRHPWLIPKERPRTRDQRAIAEAEVPDASQLSLAENLEDDDYEGLRRTKRLRHAVWLGGHEGLVDDPNPMRPEDLFLMDNVPQGNAGKLRRLSDGPPPPKTDSQLWPGRQTAPTQTQPERLFGEIGSSALRSSGVLGQNANLALGVPSQEASGEGYFDASFIEQDASEAASAGATHVNTPRSDTVERVLETSVHYPQLATDLPQDSAAPSLLGAEALVGQLNMASRESEGSPASTNSKPATPKGTVSRDFSPQSDNTKRSLQASGSTTNEPDSKRSKTKSASGSHHSQKPSGKTPIDNTTASKEGSSSGAKSKHTSKDTSSDTHQDGQQPTSQAKSASQPAETSNSQHSSSSTPSKDSTKATAAPPSFNPSV